MLPPPWLELTTSEPLRRATRVRPPGNDARLFAAENIRAQVDVSTLGSPVAIGGRAGQEHDRLRDVSSRVRQNRRPEFLKLLFGGVRANDHSVAAAFVGRFHHQLVQIFQDELSGPSRRR